MDESNQWMNNYVIYIYYNAFLCSVHLSQILESTIIVAIRRMNDIYVI